MYTSLHRFALDSTPHWLALDSALHGSALVPALHWLALGLTLVVTLAVGICVHEFLHVVPLRVTDAKYTISVFPTADATSRTTDASSPTADASSRTDWTTLKHALGGSLVRVEVTYLPRTTPEWLLRAAALAPLLLALPFALVAAGLAPNPFVTGDRFATVALVAVTACGLPSPADWAVVWHGSALNVED